MSLPKSDDFVTAEGPVSRIVRARGLLDFVIGTHRATVAEARLSRPLADGDTVRVLMQRSLEDASYEVLVLQSAADRKVLYTGPAVSKEMLGIGLALTVLGFSSGVLWLALPGVPLLALQLLFERKRARALRSFQPQEASLVEPAQPIAEIPLALPAAAPETNLWPAQILEFTHDAIIIWEMGPRGILYWNRAAEQLYGFTREQARGKVTHELLRTRLKGDINALETRLARYGVWVGELAHQRSDGRIVHVDARLSLMLQENGSWLVLEVNRDVTDLIQAERHRRQLEAQLERIRTPRS